MLRSSSISSFRGAPRCGSPVPWTSRGQQFVRFVEDGKYAGRLETAIVRYCNADGITVDLIAAIHVGEKSYYKQLSNRFETYDALPAVTCDAATRNRWGANGDVDGAAPTRAESCRALFDARRAGVAALSVAQATACQSGRPTPPPP